MHDLTAAAQWMLKFAFIALQVSFLSTAMHVVHPINGKVKLLLCARLLSIRFKVNDFKFRSLPFF